MKLFPIISPNNAYYSFILFNPCVQVKSWACQYFFLSHKTLSTSSPSLTKTCSISCTCKYSVLHVADLKTLKVGLLLHT